MIRFSRRNRTEWTRIFNGDDGIRGKRLLLQAEFTTDNLLLKLLKPIGLNKILPLGNLVNLRLGFKNIGDEVIPNIENVEWRIYYPQGSIQYRHWTLNIPNLEVDQAVWTAPEWLFMPEVPGHHTMVLHRPMNSKGSENDDLKYASPYGLIGREYALTDDMWKASFYILNRGEYITITIILVTVVLAFGSFLGQSAAMDFSINSMSIYF